MGKSTDINKTIKNLEKNGFEVHYLDSVKEVKSKLETMLNKGDRVSMGGSETLKQAGVPDFLRKGDYIFVDRNAPGLTAADKDRIYKESFAVDVYFSSSNAITEDGELYNVDGYGNRVAAITYGPESVVIIAGINKIVPDLKAAVERVKRVAAPLNCKRLNKQTYCASAGYCQGADSNDMTAGCSSPDRICNSYLISRRQPRKGRIKIILVNETLGY